MRRRKLKPSEFIEHVVMIIDKKEIGMKELYLIRLVYWNDGAIKLEKRSFYKDLNTGEYRPSRLLSFTKDDFQLITDNKDAILEAYDKK